MIAAIIIISLAFAWLGYETDWLTIRLLVGIDYKPPKYERRSWEELKDSQPAHYRPNFLRLNNGTEHFTPLCGWDWLKNTMHVIPETEVKMMVGGVRYAMHIKDTSIIKDIMRVNHLTKKQKLEYARG